jgi:enoyl-CoA hydratase/carnithine racemase
VSDILIRTEGCAGRITLNRPQALNALTLEMVQRMTVALRDWATDPSVAIIVIDAAGDRAFCAGGDITQLYAAGTAGDHSVGRTFWQQEYRLNALIDGYAAHQRKAIVSFLQGFTMGGGVGIGCHATLRIVGDTSQIAMPECGIGLVPDAGGSKRLASAPGHLGVYLGLTGARMGPGDAIHAGFADVYAPEQAWPGIIRDLEEGRDIGDVMADARFHAPRGAMEMTFRADIDRHFAGNTIAEIRASLGNGDAGFSRDAMAALDRASPLSLASTLAMLRRLGRNPDMRSALDLEYRYAFRAQEHGDFLEGIRAAVIDKDRQPRWKPAPTPADVEAMLAPLGPDTLTFEDST